LEVLLLTGRTIDQGTGKESGKFSDEYSKNVAICLMDPQDMREIGVKENTKVKVTTDFGSVIVRVFESKRAPHRKIIYIPYGPWASLIVNPNTQGTGMPSLKGIKADVVPELEEEVLSLLTLLNKKFERK
jgi:formylmethanofuran dehydrogenase subunit D